MGARLLVAEQTYLPLWSAVMPLSLRVLPVWWKSGSSSLNHSTLKGHGLALIWHLTSTSLYQDIILSHCIQLFYIVM